MHGIADKNRKYIAWWIYGIILSVAISVLYINLYNNYEGSFMSTRIQRLSSYMDYFAGREASIQPDHNASYFLYLALFAKLCGITDAGTVYYLMQVLANAIIIAAYPVIFYCLFNNRWLGIAAPFLYCINFSVNMFYRHWDCYWAHGWCIAMGMPVLLLFLCKLRERTDWKLLLILAAVLGVGNVPRMHASLPMLAVSLSGGGVDTIPFTC